jgi:hypothetical protein
MKRLAILCGMAACLSACGGEDSGGDAMAEEIGGVCVFTPGSYVASYRVLDATSSCGDTEAFPDEFITVTDDGTLVSTGDGSAPAGCADGNAVVRGCFVAFDRVCTEQTASGTLDATIGFQFWYDDGEGEVTFTGRLYSGSTLIDACVINLGATIQRR